MLTLPIVIIVSISVTISNINLLRKEGVTWRNALAFFLGTSIIVAVIGLLIFEFFLNNTSTIDIHRWDYAARFVVMFILNASDIIVVYLECILLATVITGFRAARNIPDYDRDYILILGCQIKKDGTLTNLLKSRTDRAIEFANMQENATGKDICFIPSGGKGSDEVIAEAEAIRNYLVEAGIPEDKILVENKSASTRENLIFSLELARKDSGSDALKLAFSTTNYHVFRAGLIAEENGIDAQGIGSKTKRYFGINAFVREFIAILVSERRRLGIVIGVIQLIAFLMTIFVYISMVVMS